MAQLTWRNVDSPNLSSGTDGVRTTANLLGNAADTLSRGLGQFGQAQTDQANNAALQNALQYTDPAAYQAALQGGSVLQGIDPSKVDSRTLGMLQSRAADLIQNATNQQSLDYRNYEFGRTQKANSATDAASPVLAQINEAFASGNAAKGQQLMHDNAGLLGQLTPEQQASVARNGLAFNGANIGNNQAGFNLGRDATQFGQQQLSYNENRNVQAALAQVNDPSNITADDRTVARNKVMENLSPNERYAFERAVGGGGSGNSGAGGVSATSLMTGGGTLPQNIKTVGDMVSNKSSLLGANPNGTATGLYQMTSDTWKEFGPKALGENWESANIRDPQVQAKVAGNLWDSIKDSSPETIHGRWASISVDEAKQLQGKDWDSVKDVISQKESGSTLAQMQQQTMNDANASRRIGGAQISATAEMNANNLEGQSWQKAATDQSSLSDVSARLVSDPAFKGVNQSDVSRDIQWLKGQPGGKDMNYAQLAEIYKNNRVTDTGLWDRTGRSIANSVGLGDQVDGSGMFMDRDAAAAKLLQAARGQQDSAANTTIDRNQQAMMLQQATAAQQQAQSVLNEATRQARLGTPMSPANVARYEADLARTTAQVQALQGQIQNGPGAQPRGWSTNAPVPIETAPASPPPRSIPLADQQMTQRGDAVAQAQKEFLDNLYHRSSPFQ